MASVAFPPTMNMLRPPALPPKQNQSINQQKSKMNRKMTTEEVTLTLDRKGTFQNWAYKGNNGPEFWQKNFPVAASEYQSPVDIDRSKVIYNRQLKRLYFGGCYNDFRGGEKLKLHNNGSTVKIDSFGEEVLLRRGDLQDEYEALHVIFHWGKNDSCGSEHLENGESHPMEVQIVHRNTKYTKEEMYNKLDGLLILAFWVDVVDEKSKVTNEAYKQITDHLHKVRFRGESTEIKQFPLISLLPDDTSVYYTYPGSLTTPPCNECVNWVVLSDTAKISGKQIEKFRSLYSSEDEQGPRLCDNYRPVQRLYRRKIKVCMSLFNEVDDESEDL